MDDIRKEQVQTILDLMKSLEPRFRKADDQTIIEACQKEHRVDLVEDDEEKLDALAERLARLKKTRPVSSSRVMGEVVPIRGTPAPVTTELIAVTDWKVKDRVRHNNCPEWGEGDIVSIEPFTVAPEVRQKCQILFNRVGRKILIVAPGMLERVVPAVPVKAV